MCHWVIDSAAKNEMPLDVNTAIDLWTEVKTILFSLLRPF